MKLSYRFGETYILQENDLFYFDNRVALDNEHYRCV